MQKINLRKREKKSDSINLKTNLYNKGITLIALVVTIIILLILVGVTISQITGENGLIRKAKEAVERYKNASEQEQIQLENTESKLKIDNGLSGQIGFRASCLNAGTTQSIEIDVSNMDTLFYDLRFGNISSRDIVMQSTNNLINIDKTGQNGTDMFNALFNTQKLSKSIDVSELSKFKISFTASGNSGSYGSYGFIWSDKADINTSAVFDK